MLKQRIITALVLVALVLVSLFASNSIFWRALMSLAVLIGFWEWLRFCSIQSTPQKAFCYLGFAVSMWAFQAGLFDLHSAVIGLCLLWVLLLAFTLTQRFDFLNYRVLKVLIGLVVLPAGAWFLIEFKSLENAPLWVLCFMVSVWAADIGAYFIGKRFGKTKLAPSVSPGKTVEGFVGGLGLVLVLFTPILLTIFPAKAALLLLCTVLITAIVSVGGDLFESKLKRYAKLKDSSQILPGHGGVLDRIDSLLSGAPFFSLGLILLGYL